MFSSNQVFTVSGVVSNQMALKGVLTLLKEGYDFNFKGYKIDNGSLVFFDYGVDNGKDVIFIVKENNNIDYLYNLVRLYLSSNEYTELLRIKDKDSESFDGADRKGWIITVETYGIFNKVVVSPGWEFYHK